MGRAAFAGQPRILEFLKHMAICNTVVPEVVGASIVYNSESTDEVALVQAAAWNGVVMQKRGPATVTYSLSPPTEDVYPTNNSLTVTPVPKSTSPVARTCTVLGVVPKNQFCWRLFSRVRFKMCRRAR